MERFKQEFTSAAATLNGLLMFETCLALPPSNAKHGKALTLNRALKVFRTLGLIHADCKSFSAIPNTEYGTLKEAFVKCCLDSINLNAVSSAVLEGFVARKMAKVPQTVADKNLLAQYCARHRLHYLHRRSILELEKLPIALHCLPRRLPIPILLPAGKIFLNRSQPLPCQQFRMLELPRIIELSGMSWL